MKAAAAALMGLFVAGGVVGCTAGPDYHRPAISTPAAYAQATSGERAPAGDATLSRWWDRFNDPTLTDLINRALADNLDLQTAASRVREARLQETVTRAAEYPSLNASGDVINLRTNEGSGSGGSGLTIPSDLDFYSVGFDASWELDLFGGTRRALEAARADTQAAAWARRDGEVSLTAEVANDYLTLRSLQARIALDQAEVRHEEDLFALVLARRKAGFVTQLDVDQQSGALESAAAQIPSLQAEAEGEIHALGELLGQAPETLEARLAAPASTAAVAATAPASPPALPVGLPSELLRRRPDIREAERRLAAASARIGVQVADLYPKINLIGLASFAGTSLDTLFSSKSLIAAGLGTVSQPLYNAGRSRAAVDIAREEATQATLAYRTAVLGALRDVEDALARYHSEETRNASLARSVKAARNSLTIARDQYRTGFVTFINVLQAQNALLTSEDQLTQSDTLLRTDLVALYKALGGGWSSS